MRPSPLWTLNDQEDRNGSDCILGTPGLEGHILSSASSSSTCPLRLQKAVFLALEKDPLFAGSRGMDLSLEKYRELSFLRCKRIFEYGLFGLGSLDQSLGSLDQSLLRFPVLFSCLGAYDWSLGAKLALHLMVSPHPRKATCSHTVHSSCCSLQSTQLLRCGQKPAVWSRTPEQRSAVKPEVPEFPVHLCMHWDPNGSVKF